MYCVYKHTSPSNKVYIGITAQNPLNRWQNGHGYKRNPHFWNAIVKYGWDNFKHEILFDGLTKEEACQKEIELIALYKSSQFEFGYNQDNGGSCVGKVTEETKKKIKLKLSGRTVPADVIAKRVESRKGYKHSDETRRKISSANKGKPSHNKDVPMPEEIKQKHRNTSLCKTVICVETGIEYPSLHEAERQTGINCKNISASIHKAHRHKTAGGYHWEYVKEK